MARKAKTLAIETFRVTAAFPREQIYGLTAQIQRAAVSIGSNIAEGCGRSSDREMATFLHYALGSAAELEFQLDVAREVGFGAATDLELLIQRTVEIKRMLGGLLTYLRRKR